jgi:hypothetical protein
MATMPNTFNNPTAQISTNQLRIACNQIERQIQLRSIKLSNKIQQTLSNPYALVIRQNNETADTEKVTSHSHMGNSDKRYRLFLVESDVASDTAAKLAV